jgi:hypothetical protein
VVQLEGTGSPNTCATSVSILLLSLSRKITFVPEVHLRKINH